MAAGIGPQTSITIRSADALTGQKATGLDEVARFLDTHKDSGFKLYGKKNENGETVLYMKSGTNFLDRLRPGSNFLSSHQSRAAEKRDLALTEIGKLFRGDMERFSGMQGQGLNALLDRATSNNGHGRDLLTGSRDVGALALTTGKFVALRETMIEQAAPAAPEAAQDAPRNDRADTLRGLGVNWNRPSAGDAAKIADALAPRPDTARPGETGAFALALADADSFRADLARDLVAASGGRLFLRDAQTLAAEIHRELSPGRAFEFTGQKVQLSKQDGTPTPYELSPVVVREKGVDAQGAPTVRVRTFEPDCVLATAGFGAAIRFVDPSDGKAIVIKVPLAGADAKALAAYEAELQIHSESSRTGSAHVIGFQGGARLEGGGYAIAMEFAPNGNVNEAIATLKTAVTDGRITAGQADVLRMTLIQDMAKGLAAMHDGAGVGHYDFKSPNCMIGADGKAKIVDFGTGHLGATASAYKLGKIIDNPDWKAPEMLYGQNVPFTDRNQRTDAALRDFIGLLGLTDGDKNTLLVSVTRKLDSRGIGEEAKQAFNSETVTPKADVWSLGMTAYEMLAPQRQFADISFGAQKENKLLDAYDRGAKPVGFDDNDIGIQRLFGEAADPVLPSAGSVAKDDFLNRILVTDPTARPSAAEVANDPAMGAPGIGSDEAHALLAALTAPRPSATDQQALAAYDAAITRATTALTAKMG